MSIDIGLGNWMCQRAHRTPARPALSFEGTTWSYAELQLRIDRLATSLRAHGVCRGDRVGFLGLNQPAFFETLFAAARIGAIFVPLNFRLTGAELRYIINDAGVAGTLDWDEKLPVVQSALTQAPTRASLIHRTSHRNIGRAIGIALERGYSIEGLARGVPDDNFPGLRSLLTETEKRSRLIARTEIMRTQNQTSVGFYQEQGFGYVRADDPDGDPDDTYVDPGDPYGRTCIERHGQVYSLEDARNIDDHPNGRLNWLPMPRDYKPEDTVD